MTKQRIRELIRLLPVPESKTINSSSLDESSNQRLIDIEYSFLNDPMFGWHLIKTLIKHKLPLPNWVSEDAIRRGYNFESRKRRDDAVSEAIYLNTPKNFFKRDILRACLISNSSLKEISERTNYDEDMLYVFEQLFFNVRDRRNELGYIGALVYPEGIFVTHMKDYLFRDSPGNILLRIGYTNTLDDILIMCGFSNNSMLSDSSESCAKLEQVIMNNAYQLAKTGFINQRLPGINNARSILQATKMAGIQNTSKEEIGISNIGSTIIADIIATGNMEIKKLSENNKEGQKVIDIESSK